MTRTTHTRMALTSIAMVLAWAVALSPAALMPVQEDFDDDPTGNAAPAEQGDSWTESDDADWSVVDSGGGDHAYRGSVTNSSSGYGNVQKRSALPVDGVSGGEFTITSEFTLVSLATSDGDDRPRTSLAMLCDAADFSSPFVQATFFFLDEFNDHTGKIQLAEVDGGNTIVRSTDALAVNVGTTYSWTVSGSYYPGQPGSLLNLQASLSDGADTITAEMVNATYDSSSARYFGFQDDISRDGGSEPTTLRVDHHTFNLVPEPGTLCLFGLGMLGWLKRRR